MIGEQIEQNINKKHKNKIQLVVSIAIIALIVILFAIFMSLDFSKPEEVQRDTMQVEEIGRVVDEFSKTIDSDQQNTIDAVNSFNPTNTDISEVKNTVDNFSQS
jgi:hypothetical protein